MRISMFRMMFLQKLKRGRAIIETLIAFCREYYLLTFLLLYGVLGRMSLPVVIVCSICPFWICTGILVIIELVQIPLFFHFYSYIAGFFKKIQGVLFRKKRPPVEAEEEPPAADGGRGFFISRLKGHGIWGIFILSVLPLKGCGVWSGILVGKTCGIEKKRLYAVVGSGVVLGIAALMGFGLFAQQTVLSIIDTWDIDPAVRSLFQ